MHLNSSHNFILFLSILILASCRPLTYIPQVPQTPVGETGKMEFTWAEIPDLAALQLSYSPIDHISLAASSNSGLIHLNIGYEAGLALYTDINPELQIGVLGAYGNTTIDLDHSCRYSGGDCIVFQWGLDETDYTRRHRYGTIKYQKLIAQPYLIFNGEYFQLNFGMKNTWVTYPDFNLSEEIFDYGEDSLLSYIIYDQKNAHAFIAQPYLSLYGGTGSFRAFASASFQAVVITDIQEDYFQTRSLFLSFGISKTFQIHRNK